MSVSTVRGDRRAPGLLGCPSTLFGMLASGHTPLGSSATLWSLSLTVAAQPHLANVPRSPGSARPQPCRTCSPGGYWTSTT